MEEVGSPNIEVHLYTFHMNEKDIYIAIKNTINTWFIFMYVKMIGGDSWYWAYRPRKGV